MAEFEAALKRNGELMPADWAYLTQAERDRMLAGAIGEVMRLLHIEGVRRE